MFVLVLLRLLSLVLGISATHRTPRRHNLALPLRPHSAVSRRASEMLALMAPTRIWRACVDILRGMSWCAER
ncbi:hypothetical protein B0H16DRAFT_1528107 [Mycena metata]|uniref:Secreted protein n=1 Tax=Mycena metata TaxID=1033252 RepID=A0AAD7JES1_9AGAR|nr:hypothetical protein B0H16DRAFT_1528107 [Mycena metata]